MGTLDALKLMICGREDAGRELAQLELRGAADLGVGGVEAGARLEVDLHDDLSVDGGRFDVLDVVDQRGERFLVGGGEAAFELFGVESGVLPGDRDDGDIDVGEDVVGVLRMMTGPR